MKRIFCLWTRISEKVGQHFLLLITLSVSVCHHRSLRDPENGANHSNQKSKFFFTPALSNGSFFLQQSLRGKNWPPSINALSMFCCLTVETYRISKCFNCWGSDAISFKSQLCCLEQGSNLATARAQQAHACKARSFSFMKAHQNSVLKWGHCSLPLLLNLALGTISLETSNMNFRSHNKRTLILNLLYQTLEQRESIAHRSGETQSFLRIPPPTSRCLYSL